MKKRLTQHDINRDLIELNTDLVRFVGHLTDRILKLEQEKLVKNHYHYVSASSKTHGTEQLVRIGNDCNGLGIWESINCE